MKKKISIHDIARELKVSATTISFVLNGRAEEKRISPEVTKRVLTYVDSIDFKPNIIAQSLRTGKSYVIAMLVEDISDPFFSGISRLAEIIAYDKGYKIFYASTENSAEKTRALIRLFRDRQVDGYIIAPPPGIEQDIVGLMEDNLPVVLFDRYFPEVPTSNILVDNYGGAYTAVRHLQNNGYKHIGLVTLNSDQTQMTGRLQGYEDAVTKLNGGKHVLTIDYNSSGESILDNIQAFLQANTLDAMLLTTNYLAISGLKVLDKLEYRIPSEMGVVGFDDNNNFELFKPAVTSVEQPVKDIAENVIEQLLDKLSGRKKSDDTIVLPTRLIIRKSSILNN